MTRNRRERVAGLGLVAVGAVVLVLVPFATTIVPLAVLLAGLGATVVTTVRTVREPPLS